MHNASEINPAHVDMSDLEAPVDEATHAAFRSRLGALACLSMTIAYTAPYIGYIQRPPQTRARGQAKLTNRVLQACSHRHCVQEADTTIAFGSCGRCSAQEQCATHRVSGLERRCHSFGWAPRAPPRIQEDTANCWVLCLRSSTRWPAHPLRLSCVISWRPPMQACASRAL